MGSHSGLRKFAEKCHQSGDGLLKLVGASQVSIGQCLLDLPVEPERCLIKQRAVLPGTMTLEEFIGVLAGREMQHPQFKLPLQGQLFNLSDGAVRSPHAGSVRIEVEDDPLAVADPAQLCDLLIAQGRAQGGDSIGDSRRMHGNHIEITLHHDGAIRLANGIGRLIQSEKMFALFEHLCFR